MAALVAGFGGGKRSKPPKAGEKGADPRLLMVEAISAGIPGARAGRVPPEMRKLLHPENKAKNA